MNLTFALDELYETGWSAINTAGCETADDGRLYPSVEMVTSEFEAAGFSVSVTHIQLFDCYRAEWADNGGGSPAGAVVGASEAEAAIFALSRLRRALASA